MKTYNQFITELSARTLASYIRKAAGSLRGAAAQHGRNVTLGKPIEYRKYLNKSKKTSSPLGSTERMMNRETGIQRAADKLAGKAEEQRLDNIIRSTVDGGAPKKITKPTFDKKDPLGINYLKDIRKDYLKRTKKESVNMKSYNQFITELNKYEKFLLKQGIKAIKRLNPGQSHKSIKKSALRTTKSFRSDPDNPFVSPRREAENLVKTFQKEVPGQKGENIMKLKDKTGKPKYVNYDPTRVRQGDDVQSKVTGSAQSMRRQSKKEIRDFDKELKGVANKYGDKKIENARTILKNTGDQHSAIYKAPAYKVNPTDSKIDSVFPKNKLGAPTTTNIPKGAVPDAEKKLKAKSIIRKFKRRKK